MRVRGGKRRYLDGQLRFAKKLSEKFAFKIVGSYLTADDWLADNYAATSLRVERRNNAEGSNLGYDAVNRYGDVGNTFGADATVPVGLWGRTVFMPGFTEREVVADDDNARAVRVQPTLSYLLSNSVKVTVGGSYARGTASYQSSSRYRFKGFGTNQFHGEIKGPRWFLRGTNTTWALKVWWARRSATA